MPFSNEVQQYFIFARTSYSATIHREQTLSINTTHSILRTTSPLYCIILVRRVGCSPLYYYIPTETLQENIVLEYRTCV